MTEVLDAIVVGAGSAGLSVSYFLKQKGLEHLLLERSRVGETWRTQRWNSFRLNSPNVRSTLPGDSYVGLEPWGTMTVDEFVAYLESYAARHALPVITGILVSKVVNQDGHFVLTTSQGPLVARNIVAATGNLNRPVRPSWSDQLPAALRQIDCTDYRSAAELSQGAVLVVGSGQTGGQIAEDLVQAGRTVYLATSRTGRMVRSYRGGDILNWLTLCGFYDVPVRDLVLPSGKLPPRSLLGATHTISLQSLSAQGVTLLGRLRGVQGRRLLFSDDVAEHIKFANKASTELKRLIDRYIQDNRLSAPDPQDDPAEIVAARVTTPPVLSLDWASENISSVIWCVGFVGDFGWLQVPEALDEAGQPNHDGGVGRVPGIYFAGLDFGSTRKSGTIPALAEEAGQLVERMMA